MGVLGDLWDWVRGGTDSGTGSSRRIRPVGDDRPQAGYRKCLNCGGEHSLSETLCPGTGRRIEWAPEVVTTQATISTAAINVAIAIAFAGGVIYFGVPAALGRTAVAVGIGLVATNSADAGTGQGDGGTTKTDAGTGQGDGNTTTTGDGTSTGTTTTTYIDPTEVKTWVRTGPFYASADTEGRLPKYMQVNGTSYTYTVEKDGKTWTNTHTWDGLPPETIDVGQEVHLTMNVTTQQGWANIGGWWNSNCRVDMKGDNEAGSDVNYRRQGGPHNIGDITFTFQPSNGEPYIQLSAGRDPAPDTWVLITFKYVPKK